MTSRLSTVRRAVLPAVLALSVLLAYAAVAPAARADSAPTNPALPATPATVSADALPTVQINGVVWSQVVVGNTVYVAGEFTRARPAGSAAGTNETVRNNLLAYDIRTGALITSFAPDLNAQARVVAASPDGSRIYVGGDFDVANGKARYGIAAYSTATGQLIDSFQPIVGSEVRAIAATNSTVYIGGFNFGFAGGAARGFLAAFNAADGSVTNWAPVVNNTVDALAVVNNGSAVVIGGHMTSLNGATVAGIGEVNSTTGTSNLPFAASTFTGNGGNETGFTSFSQDADTLYATGYVFGAPGTLEGMLAINPNGGAVRWVDDCHGDSYSVWASGTVEYLAGHAHVCSNIGGFPQVGGTDQTLWTHYRGIAFSRSAVNTVGTQTGFFEGSPAPKLLNFFPEIEQGSYTGQNQGPWSVSGNSSYVVYGGEFPLVNGVKQQGLVRFAVPSIAPNKVGPDATTGLVPSLRSTTAGTVRVQWQTTSDQDNGTLTYDVYRSDKPGAPVYTTSADSTFWSTPVLSFRDSTAPAGATVSYSITARDPFGNAVSGASRSVTVAGGTATPTDDYAAAVLADGPSHYWRLGETSGGTAADYVGTNDLALGAGVTRGRTGALNSRADKAATFNGASNGTGSTSTVEAGPDSVSVEAWFTTTSTTGGQIVGMGSTTTGASPVRDRYISINGAGQLSFNVYPGKSMRVLSGSGYNDGKWHHVVATMGVTGLALYLDGKLVGTTTGVTSGEDVSSYWRVGGDTVWDGSGPYLSGGIDDVAIYSRTLTAAQIAAHYSRGTSAPSNVPPMAAFTSTSTGLTAALDATTSTDADGTISSYAWKFGDNTTGTGKTVSHLYSAGGTYSVTLTVTDNAGATAAVTTSVTVTAPPAGGSAIATDAFGREVTAGWGSADLGGGWSINGTAANAVVTGGTGRLTAAAGGTTGAYLPVSARDVSLTADVSLDKAAAGAPSYAFFGARAASASTMYAAVVYYNTDGKVSIAVQSQVNGAETYLAYTTLPAAYTAGTALKLRFEASGTGTTTVRAKLWPATSAEPTAWSVTATDTTAALQGAAGVYAELYNPKAATVTQTLRVDNLSVTVPGGTPAPANVAPTAAFTSTVSGLTAALDGSTSSDPDGTIAGWAWNFGDSTSGSGKTASHTYAAAGTYPVALTVTDNAGATTTVTKQVTVTAPVAGTALAADAFGREVTGGWGTADVGGAWATGNTAGNVSATAGTGRLAAAAGVTSYGYLPISVRDVAFSADVTLQSVPTGGVTYVSLGVRVVNTTRYEAFLYYATDGTVYLVLNRVVNGADTNLTYTSLGTFAAGTTLTVRVEATGATTTTLSAKAWTTGTAEPATWQLSATDSTAGLQVAGGVYVELYNAASATTAQALKVDNVWVGAAGTQP